MSTCNVFMFIFMSMLVLSVYGERQKKLDEATCGAIVEVLCVKDLLANIAKAAEETHVIVDEIEKKIFQHDPNNDSLRKNIDHKTKILDSSFPTSKYHNDLPTVNNIDKNGLIRLIKEESDAIIYLIYSIGNLLHENSIFGQTDHESFTKIQTILQKQMLCNYRNILRVYSETWLPVNQITGVQISRTRKRELSSFMYNTNSIIIIRLIRTWMKRIDDFTDNLENKLF